MIPAGLKRQIHIGKPDAAHADIIERRLKDHRPAEPAARPVDAQEITAVEESARQHQAQRTVIAARPVSPRRQIKPPVQPDRGRVRRQQAAIGRQPRHGLHVHTLRREHEIFQRRAVRLQIQREPGRRRRARRLVPQVSGQGDGGAFQVQRHINALERQSAPGHRRLDPDSAVQELAHRQAQRVEIAARHHRGQAHQAGRFARLQPEGLDPLNVRARPGDPGRARSVQPRLAGADFHLAILESGPVRSQLRRDAVETAACSEAQVFGRHIAEHGAADFKFEHTLCAERIGRNAIGFGQKDRRFGQQGQKIARTAAPRPAKARQPAARIEPLDLDENRLRLQRAYPPRPPRQRQRIAAQLCRARQAAQRRHGGYIAHIGIGEIECQRQLVILQRPALQRLCAQVYIQHHTAQGSAQHGVADPVARTQREIHRPVAQNVVTRKPALHRPRQRQRRKPAALRLVSTHMAGKLRRGARDCRIELFKGGAHLRAVDTPPRRQALPAHRLGEHARRIHMARPDIELIVGEGGQGVFKPRQIGDGPAQLERDEIGLDPPGFDLDGAGIGVERRAQIGTVQRERHTARTHLARPGREIDEGGAKALSGRGIQHQFQTDRRIQPSQRRERPALGCHSGGHQAGQTQIHEDPVQISTRTQIQRGLGAPGRGDERAGNGRVHRAAIQTQPGLGVLNDQRHAGDIVAHLQRHAGEINSGQARQQVGSQPAGQQT